DEDMSGAEPLLVGAAAEQFGQNASDTSRHEPVVEESIEIHDPEELRYAPLAPRRFRWVRRIIIALVLLAVLGLALKWLYDWTQRQYYVAEYDGKVAIYRGLDGSIAGYELSEVYDPSDIDVAELPEYWRG